MEFYCMKIFPEVALLKFTGWIDDFKGSFKWLQYGWSVTWQACCFSSFTSVGCIHQLPAFQKSLHSSRNGSSRLLYPHWMMFLDRFSVINFVYFVFLSCKISTYELGFGDLVLFSRSKIQRICVSGGCTFLIFRGSFMMSDLNARYLFNCVFFRSLFPPKLQVSLRPIEARSMDRLLWTLKRSSNNPSPSFFSSAYEFFNWFVLIRNICSCFVFFFRLFGLQSSTVYSEACKMQNLLQAGLSSSTPSILYTWLVFNCYFWCEFLLLASFFKVVSRKDY